MSSIETTVEPESLGFSPDRLRRIATHFEPYVADGRLPGYTIAVARHGQMAYVDTHGMADIEGAQATTPDTIYRIFSMTKPITSVACLMLMEEGKLQLTDLVSDYIPAFAGTKVWKGGSILQPQLDAQSNPMRLWHLLTHTAGLTYGFLYSHPVDDLYRRAGFDLGPDREMDLATVCDRYAALPLLFQPGSSWNYSVATDILGRVVEVAAGMPLDEFFRTRIFEPLGMHDTDFYVPPDKLHRLAALYGVNAADKRARRFQKPLTGAEKPVFLSGGGGLMSTAHDYWQFIRMLEHGGTLGGKRLLSPTTIRLMTANHLPNNQDVSSFGQPVGEEVSYDGLGFGLGVSVVCDQIKTRALCANGTYGWGGLASTVFWVDPASGISAMFFTQLMPSSTYPIRPFLRQLVYQALVD
jgi:CubicO group peptidase (beta-lactamase class C family)